MHALRTRNWVEAQNVLVGVRGGSRCVDAQRLPLCRGVSSNDFPGLENLCKKIIKEKQPFERLEIKKETLLDMFKVGVMPWASQYEYK